MSCGFQKGRRRVAGYPQEIQSWLFLVVPGAPYLLFRSPRQTGEGAWPQPVDVSVAAIVPGDIISVHQGERYAIAVTPTLINSLRCSRARSNWLQHGFS
jgi:hypothetical protein